MAEFLLKNGADINVLTQSQSTPLHGAAFHGHPDMVRWLVAHKADIDVPNVAKFTPILSAAAAGRGEIVDLMIELGADPKAVNIQGHGIIHYLAWHGDFDRYPRLCQERTHGLGTLPQRRVGYRVVHVFPPVWLAG